MPRVDPRISGYLSSQLHRLHAHFRGAGDAVDFRGPLPRRAYCDGGDHHHRRDRRCALARKYRVTETAAGIDGGTLDNIVDFLSYVFLPMLFALQTNLFLEPTTLFITFVMFASAFGFSRTTAKLASAGFFVGFPSYWNIVVFYLFLLSSPALLNTVLVVALAFLVFIPVRFLYVSRLRRSRLLHFGLSAVWGLACLVALFLDAGGLRNAFLYVSLVYPVFYTAHSILLDVLDRQERAVLN